MIVSGSEKTELNEKAPSAAESESLARLPGGIGAGCISRRFSMETRKGWKGGRMNDKEEKRSKARKGRWFFVIGILFLYAGLATRPAACEEPNAEQAREKDRPTAGDEARGAMGTKMKVQKRLRIMSAAEVLPSPADRRDASGGDERYVDRVGEVSFAADLFLASPSRTGERRLAGTSFRKYPLEMSLFPEKSFDIRVQSESRPKKDVLSLLGSLSGENSSSFSMTVTPDRFLVTLRDADNAKIYRVVGDTKTGKGTVREIDLRKIPPIRYSPPLVPEDD